MDLNRRAARGAVAIKLHPFLLSFTVKTFARSCAILQIVVFLACATTRTGAYSSEKGAQEPEPFALGS